MTDTGQAVRDALERIDDFMLEEIMNDQSDAPHRADDFNGDTEHLVDCIDALLDLDDAKALVPHGLGGKGSHAYRLLCAARQRLAALANLAPEAGKPVAWMYSIPGANVQQVYLSQRMWNDGWTETPLYAHPTQPPTAAEATIETVARAIAGAEYGDGFDRPWEPFIAHAKAAISAFPRPLEVMREACAQAAESEAGAYGEDGEGDYWIALRIAKAIRALPITKGEG